MKRSARIAGAESLGSRAGIVGAKQNGLVQKGEQRRC